MRVTLEFKYLWDLNCGRNRESHPMTRMSKQEKRRAVSPRRPRLPGIKTGPKKDELPKGYREHANALEGAEGRFGGKVR